MQCPMFPWTKSSLVRQSTLIILICDHSTGVIYFDAVPCKGTLGSTYPATQLAPSIKQLRYNKIVFKLNTEPANLDLRPAVCQILRKDHGMTVIEEECSVEGHQANGVVESANGQFGGMVPTLTDDLMFNYCAHQQPSTTYMHGW